MGAFVKPNATATRFTGTITCYTDPATGLVAGVQLGSAPALCSTDGTPRSLTVPADGAIVGVIATVDPKTALLGQLTLKIESPTASASIVTCGGSVGGVPVDALPKLTALASLGGSCGQLSAAGRRRALAAGVAIDAATLTVTAAPLSAATGATGTVSGPVTLLSNLLSTAAQLTAGAYGLAVGFKSGVAFTTAASPVTINTVVLPLAYTTAAGSCTVSIQTLAGGLPTGTIVGAAVTRPVTTLFSTATTLVSFDGLGAAVAASTQYTFVVTCDALMYWMAAPTNPPPTTFSGPFTAGNLVLDQGSGWAVGSPINLYGVQFQITS